MIVPVLEPNVRQLNAYFPAGVWFDYAELSLWSNTTSGELKTIDLPLQKIGVMVSSSGRCLK